MRQPNCSNAWALSAWIDCMDHGRAICSTASATSQGKDSNHDLRSIPNLHPVDHVRQGGDRDSTVHLPRADGENRMSFTLFCIILLTMAIYLFILVLNRNRR